MNCLQNPPQLEINKVLYDKREMPTHVRLEQRIVWNLLFVLEKAGFHCVSVDDGDENTKTTGKVSAMELLFNLDDAYLFVKHDKAVGIDSDRKQWIRFVFGNGVDVISDYNASSYQGFQKVMDGFQPEEYA